MFQIFKNFLQPEYRGSSQPHLDSALRRLLTYPLRYLQEFLIDLQMLANLGLYFVKDNNREYLRCNFCEFRINQKEYPTYFSSAIQNPSSSRSTDCLMLDVENDDGILPPSSQEPKFDLNLAMHRLFTFPLVFHRLFQFELLHFLSDLGFYFSNECVNCKFCGFVITTGQLSEYFSHGLEHVRKVILKFHKNCKIDGNDSENVPMGKSLDDHLNYNYEAHRLYSLLKKNDWQYVTPFDLAKSGFYYSGREDNVICVFCNLEVRGWEEGDTPD
ncbi:Hypothetical predicted protein, partial [Cloeon dipterum]